MREMITGAVLFAAGVLVDRVVLARLRRQVTAICGCGHRLAFHDPKRASATGRTAGLSTAAGGDKVGYEGVPCTCRQYDGPTPLPTVYAPEVSG